jgi:hypothetical protein
VGVVDAVTLRERAAVLGIVAATTMLVPVAASPTVTAAPGAAQRVFMITDSVGLGAKAAMPAAFPAGWQVTVTGKPGLFVEQLVAGYVNPAPSSLFGDAAIVAGGYNYPYWDPARFDRSIDTMVEAMLAKGTKRVFWVTLRDVKPQFISASAWRQVQPYYWYFPRVNEHLRAALARHPALSLIDWASIADRSGLTYDAIHLNTFGAAEYSALAASTVMSGATRKPAGHISMINLDTLAGISGDTAAVAVQATIVNPRTQGYVSVYPCAAEPPLISTVNAGPAQTIGGHTIVRPGPERTICVFQSAEAHVVIDVSGAFDANAGYAPITPVRALDSRAAALPPLGQPFVVRVADWGVEATSRAVQLAVTTIGVGVPGNVFVYPCADGAPAVPTTISTPGVPVNLFVLARPDSAGTVCVVGTQLTQVIVDVIGSFDATSDVHVIPKARLFDSGGVIGGGAVVDRMLRLTAAIGDASGVLTTIGSTNAANRASYVTSWPCAGPRPGTSVLNTTPNRLQVGAAVTSLDAAGSACWFVSGPMRLVVDINAWFGDGYRPITPVRALDTRIG